MRTPLQLYSYTYQPQLANLCSRAGTSTTGLLTISPGWIFFVPANRLEYICKTKDAFWAETPKGVNDETKDAQNQFSAF